MLKGKRILMTGMTGQLGESLVLGLAPHNEIWGLARYTAPGSKERVERQGVRPIVCDYTTNDFEGVPGEFDLVLHAAAAVSPKSSEEGIVQNAEGTGFLLHHCRKSKAFIHISATGVYKDHPDQKHRYLETDQLGGMSPHSPFYGVSKAAGEAVTRTVGRIVGIPTTILRMNIAYGRGGNGGVPARQLEWMLKGEPVPLPETWTAYHVPIHEDDLCEQIEGAMDVANVKTTIMNWGGPDMVSTKEIALYIGEQIGVTPTFSYSDATATWSRAVDSSRRDALIGPCRVHWKEGVRRMIKGRHPEVKLRDPVH